MSLQDEIQTLMGELGKKVPAEKMEKVGALIGRLAEDGVARTARQAGDDAPPFSLKNVADETVALRDLLAQGPVVTVFYRGEWCPFCDLTLRAFQHALPEIAARGATLVAISPQTPDHSRLGGKAPIRGNRADVLDHMAEPGLCRPPAPGPARRDGWRCLLCPAPGRRSPRRKIPRCRDSALPPHGGERSRPGVFETVSLRRPRPPVLYSSPAEDTLEAHTAFMARLQKVHGRKYGFWGLMTERRA